MNYSEFENEIKIKSEESILEKIIDYMTCALSIFAGLYFFYLMNFTNWFYSNTLFYTNQISSFLVYFLIVFLIGLGVLGFYDIANRRKIRTVEDSTSLKAKKDKVSAMIEKFKLTIQSENEAYFYTIRRKFFSNSLIIFIHFDANNYYFNVQTLSSRGISDFGRASRYMKKIIHELVN